MASVGMLGASARATALAGAGATRGVSANEL
jgi:hypothetical protein